MKDTARSALIIHPYDSPDKTPRRCQMKEIAIVVATLLLPALLHAAEIKGTVLKYDQDENRLVLKTERGEETYETTKETKGRENLKVGSNVTVIFTEKDGDPKVIEISRN
jgi:hypothetical protein